MGTRVVDLSNREVQYVVTESPAGAHFIASGALPLMMRKSSRASAHRGLS